jgi:hypothetical protein
LLVDRRRDRTVETPVSSRHGPSKAQYVTGTLAQSDCWSSQGITAEEPAMIRSHIVLASGLSAFTGMTLAGIMSASAQGIYIDEGAYAMPPAYVAPAVPPAYYVAPQGYVAAPAYTAPAAPLAVIPVTPPGYAAAPPYVAPPAITPRGRVTRHVIVETRPVYPRNDYGYVTYEQW